MEQFKTVYQDVTHAFVIVLMYSQSYQSCRPKSKRASDAKISVYVIAGREFATKTQRLWEYGKFCLHVQIA